MLRLISLTLAVSLPLFVHAATLKDFELSKTLEKVARESSVGTPRAINEDILDQGYTVDGSVLVNHLSVRSEHAAQMRGNPDVVRAQLANSVCRNTGYRQLLARGAALRYEFSEYKSNRPVTTERFSKADCLDLPPVLKTTREVAMTAQQQKYYNHLKNDMLVIAAGQTISAVNKAALVNKLLQVSAGGVYSEDGEVVEFDATPRMNLLLEILEETNRKVLIFATYRSSIDAIDTFLTKNGYKVGVIHGGIPATKRGELINRFQNTDQLDLMLMQPQATAHGITLTAADTVVFFGPLMSIELYLQCIARADRKGQTSDKVTVVHIQSSPVEKKMFAAMEGRVNEHALLTTMFDEEMGINA